jgi:hypothetical protein
LGIRQEGEEGREDDERYGLARIKGRKLVFAGTLIDTINFGRKRIAIFSVPK